jgi:3-isopropylmalate dehydrogenase
VRHSIAVIAGDGIGTEVTRQSEKALRALAEVAGFEMSIDELDAGTQRYLRTGEILSDEEFAWLGTHDAILMGAIGLPEAAPDGLLQRGILMRIRVDFDLFVGVRPSKLHPGVVSPLGDRTPEEIDLVVVRDNTEGLFVGAGGTAYRNTKDEVAIQESINTWRGIERVVRYAFELAGRRKGQVTVCHKTNMLYHAGDLWERVAASVSEDFPDVRLERMNVDAAAMHLISDPGHFDVITVDTMFGDILSDIGAAIQGGIGLAPSGNLNPSRSTPAMFEPIHGSAPDIIGTGLADPTASLLSSSMMLDYLGEASAAERLEDAVDRVLVHRSEHATGVNWSTDEIGDRVVDAIRSGS